MNSDGTYLREFEFSIEEKNRGTIPVDNFNTRSSGRKKQKLYTYKNINNQYSNNHDTRQYNVDSIPSNHCPVANEEQVTPSNSNLFESYEEIAKRERKKQKNRVAASKCRKKKLEREATLEVRLKELKTRNMKLINITNILKQQLNDLKKNLMEHIVFGCMMKPYP
ncbi:transcription factor AP-1-like [Xenia sp. Carnegie-2017]|uniref:transcription factor AP-1-like n=1 Tax=Xenia sp. Carnegie-2017 TaxID=2897299 RepID=UPI001F042483|nr:transcription factor AP-1-like [Xenia sp. Carnegie-2017]